MSVLCTLFGHKAPVYKEKGWYSPGEEYVKVTECGQDGLGVIHATLQSECPRCGKEFHLARIHIPDAYKAKEAYTKVEAAGHLLAVIHRDGGHHMHKVGFVKACKEAEAKVLEDRSLLEAPSWRS